MSFNPKTDLTISRVIKAPRSAVWTAWKDPEHLAKWWTPVPVKTIVDKHEFRPGGSFDTTMIMEDGSKHPSQGCFLEVIENERIVFTDALCGGWRPNAETFFTAIITLEEHPDGTKYTALAMHKDEADCRKHAEMGFEHGWGTVIEQLGQFAEKLTKDGMTGWYKTP